MTVRLLPGRCGSYMPRCRRTGTFTRLATLAVHSWRIRFWNGLRMLPTLSKGARMSDLYMGARRSAKIAEVLAVDRLPRGERYGSQAFGGRLTRPPGLLSPGPIMREGAAHV